MASELRGPGLISPVAKHEYRALVVGQPLILTREPMNRVDPNAIIAYTAKLQPVAYVAKEHAAIIAPSMDQGVVWLATVNSTANAFSKPQITLWSAASQSDRRRERVVEHYMRFGACEDVARMIVAGDYMMPFDEDGEAAGSAEE